MIISLCTHISRGTPYIRPGNLCSLWCLGETSLPGGQARFSSRTLLKYSEFVLWSSFLSISWKLSLALATNLSVFSSEHELPQLLSSSYVTRKACIAKSFDTMSFPPNSQESRGEFTGWWKEEHLNRPLGETFLPSTPVRAWCCVGDCGIIILMLPWKHFWYVKKWNVCKYFFAFTVYIHREHFNLNIMQWVVSKTLETIFCLWIGNVWPSYRKYKLKITYPTGFVLQWALSACIFSVLSKVLLHVMYNFVLNVFNVVVHMYI